ncbi:MBL fold metallo-hydrolase [Maritimibacter sp. UBA3975]|uniref:MBL fold metallo-hydrolase n=1 Tax=Maritimibacter sp. UBA3975 TaxID=1946833 RepID=UPI000C0A2D0C|nr:MBL fold metallo-hydrolase [Maritimibacter sp. UBA3975]MAM60207.1 MBL fold metallo-hydrolase [Maritimibacter sp.]|tara:strand:+ start:2638 stop:3507 length:870 start_codon:yes stop_codon:yes gene_type:complete
MTRAEVKTFWDETTGSWQYVVHDPATRKGAIIDPVLDFDQQSGSVVTRNAERILDYVKEAGLDIVWVLDTHPHADHFSAAHWLAQRLDAPRGIGEKVTGVQELWADFYHTPEFPCDGRQWDNLFADGDTFAVGELEGRVMFTPGHTLASVSYVIGDTAFVADTLMMPDVGTSRADFPGGSSSELYDSLQRLLSLPDETRLFIGHDYAPGDRDAACEATVAEHEADNAHLAGDVSKADYQNTRDARDDTLPLPDIMLYALQVNIRGGRLPEPESNGCSYLKVPVNLFEPR